MKLLGRKKDETATAEETPAADDDVATSSVSRGSRTTAPKGRPTPKRSDRRRGPVAPAPMTAAEARARRKSLAGPKLSREERKAQSAARRAQMSQRRERMMAGDEAYLLPRDQGPVRRFVRDVVDSRRNLLGLFMPSALGLMFVMFAVPQLQFYMSPAMMVLMVLMAIDGIILGRKVSKLVDEKFPDNTESRWKLGLYAAGRASQLRRMRAPRPQVKRGSKVT
ncbi:DUF3043 domain-containing protein [Mycobacterium branderi]|uniref:DUF3043 domain-containing protein n=1 Tax=Mycobacterium branderi TaxID=43348 RepID=A0A7I7W8K5_9MYCO|nr:DUF3043 domain-containing protein [Mycobacterium branderi]MCV7231361.1 DUF3043 domain-containing protein [Mycobacterium branderi]ORA34024.1 hypothetical protein BST20_20535 [Mycobacterium branderi]BBZ13420.1 hypothetical protein MBRA_36150 [Mycobacterium branderi]